MIDILALRINDATWFKPIIDEEPFKDRTPYNGSLWLTDYDCDEMDAKWKLGHLGLYQWLSEEKVWSRRMIEKMSERPVYHFKRDEHNRIVGINAA